MFADRVQIEIPRTGSQPSPDGGVLGGRPSPLGFFYKSVILSGLGVLLRKSLILRGLVSLWVVRAPE
jgi:hypothetical protein